MAKTAKFIYDRFSFEAALTKTDRDKIYGFIEEVATDQQGRTCILGSMLDDGQTLLLPGSTVLKTVDEQNREVDKKTLKTVMTDGSDAVLMPAVFDQDVQLLPATMDDLFNLEVSAVYQLIDADPDSSKQMLELTAGDQLFQFRFNYRADYDAADAILLGNGKDVFVLTGRILSFEYLTNTQVILTEEENVSEEEETIDFGML